MSNICVRKPRKEKSNLLIRTIRIDKEGRQVETRNVSCYSRDDLDSIHKKIIKNLNIEEGD